MADLNYQSENLVVSRPNWGALWAGMFTFMAIWAVFGSLGLGVFASSANPNAAAPVSGMNVGMAVWSIILTIIAFFVAGRVTGQLSGITNARHGMMQGMIMFGVSVAASLLIVVIGGNAFGNTEIPGNPHSGYVLSIFSDLGWTLFVGLFLGWLAAMAGASSAHKELRRQAVQQHVTTHA